MSYKEIHVMVDLETLGLCKNAAITRIAAVAFDFETGPTQDEFDVLINVKSCVRAGLKVDGSSVEWWLKQEEAVIQNTFIASLLHGVTLPDALQQFTDWIETLKKLHDSNNVMIWGNGVASDNVWLYSAYQACHKEVPWKFYNDRDLRTLVYLGDCLTHTSFKRALKFEGERHNPLDDCKHQVTYAVSIMKALKAVKAPRAMLTGVTSTSVD